ncbi:cytochrome c biogenesis CcdA family protein [Synechococcus sp. RSCCF101]|uniref:cytochrome c biogenesis CcdA family protein n=1 Tax=Synechococcus sp. RSCCF101 TaxID=2511069 RepID=UPI003519F0C1
MVSDLALRAEEMLEAALGAPSATTLLVVFAGGLITSLGPCSLSLLPVTLAYLAGFEDGPRSPWLRSGSFASGVILSLVILGLISGTLGRLYGQIPGLIPTLVALLALLMGLNLLGVVPLRLPAGPDPERWRSRVPSPLAPMAAGLAFGLAGSSCTTPVLAVLLAWMARTGDPVLSTIVLTTFGAGQVVPLLLAGTAAASLPTLLSLRGAGRWVPSLSGVVLVSMGLLTLVARWS